MKKIVKLFLAAAVMVSTSCLGLVEEASASPWTHQMGTAGNDYATCVAVDGGGNTYMAGLSNGSLDGNISSGNNDFFLMKYDSAGTKQWTRQMGTTGDDQAWCVTTDTGGNVYVAGWTNGGLDGNTTAGGYDGFVVKFNPSGVKQWTKQVGTAVDDSITGVTVDQSGNIYVVGNTNGSFPTFTNAGFCDFFVIKYDSSGVEQWTKQIGSLSCEEAHGVTTDSSGNVYVAGWTNSNLNGNTSAGNADLFVLKIEPSAGVTQWTKQLGTSGDDYAYGVGVDADDNVYAAGWTNGGLDGNTNAGGFDLIVVKYNSSGVKEWTRQSGTVLDDYATSVSVDAVGSVYAAGYTNGNLDGNINTGGYDSLLVKYDSSGVKQKTWQMGTTQDDWSKGIAVDGSLNVYVTGWTNGSLDLHTSAGGADLFLTKLEQKPTSASLASTFASTTVGAPTSWPAAASGGAGPYEYSFWLYGPGTGNSWIKKADYSTHNIWYWTPTSSDIGTSLVCVWVRDVGSSSSYEAAAFSNVTVSAAVPPTGATLTPVSASTTAGAITSWTASASGGSGPYVYSFWLYGPGTGNTWVQKANYSSYNIWYWTPSSSDIGTSTICVWVKNSGSPASYETAAFSSIKVSAAVPPTAAKLTPVSASTTAGTITSWTASASGGSGPYEYSFWLYGPGTGNTWVQKANYSSYNIWYWTPTSSDIGTNYVMVWVRNSGSAASYEAYVMSSDKVSAAVPPTAASLTPVSANTTAGTITSWTASASGGSGPYEYTFWLYGPGTGNTWVQKASYSSYNIWYWTPSSSDKGTSTICVWVRNSGSSAPYEAASFSAVTVQ